MGMRYLLGSGYVEKTDWQREFMPVWLANIQKASPAPSRIVVISNMGSSLPVSSGILDEIMLDGNLGHFMDLLNGNKTHQMSGWMGSIVALALIAYCDESDFVYFEQDCLAFGPWLTKLYESLGDRGVIFGRKHQSAPWMSCSQSLFIVRHSYIPKFVRLILEQPPQNTSENLGEHIFVRLMEQFPAEWNQFDWGPGDRERPLDLGREVFYGQQWSREEVEDLRNRGLL